MNRQKDFIGLALCLAVLTGCQGVSTGAAPTVTPQPMPTPEPWHVVLTSETQMLTTLGGFFDPEIGVTIGDDRQVHSSSDGGATWIKSQIQSTGLFGMDFLDGRTVWACGYRNVRVSSDGGQTWEVAADFGAYQPEHCRNLSLADAKNAWAATQTQLGITADGGATWTIAALPADASLVSAIDQFDIGQGYLLDDAGKIYLTLDNAATWTLAGALPLAGEKITIQNAPSAAMGWQNEKNGLVVIAALKEGAATVMAYQTADGGKNWRSEILTVPYGSPVISQGGRYVSIFTQPNKLTLLEFPIE
jgi:photosystem II stability/assembly factor-like uncharacterized protein